MAGITKADLRKKIADILEGADLAKTSAKKVREELEADLGVDLLPRKKEIDALVMEFVNTNSKNGDAEDDDDDDDDDQDEDDNKKKGNKRASASKKPAAKKSKKDDSDEEEEEEASEPDDDSDDYAAKKSKPPKARKLPPKKKRGSDSEGDDEGGKKKKKGGGGKGRAGSGYTKSLKLSSELADLVGQESMARHEVVKKVWAIIKERNLYDPKNKQFAICDDALFKVFGTKRFRTFGMMKYLKNHFIG